MSRPLVLRSDFTWGFGRGVLLAHMVVLPVLIAGAFARDNALAVILGIVMLLAVVDIWRNFYASKATCTTRCPRCGLYDCGYDYCRCDPA